MKAIFSKSLFFYAISILIIVSLTGAILSLVVTNYIVLISVLSIEYIVLITMLLYIFDKYIKPIQVASNTVSKLVEGNYRARIHHPLNGSIGSLSSRINALAKNLSELSMHEQMQSEQLSTVINNTESGLVLIDEKGYIHLVNRKFISMFGEETKDYIGFLYYDVLENVNIHQTVQDTFLYEKNIKKSFTHVKDIDRSYIEIVGAPIFNEKNLLKGAVLVFYDITELKNLELMRKDFVANVSHELKTPITSIKGFLETLVEGSIDKEETKEEFLGIIYEESKRLQLLIDDLLILSNLEQDNFKLNLEKVDLPSLVKDIIPMMDQKAKNHSLTFTYSVDESLTFTADIKKIKQIVINLLDNAISYTPEKGDVILKMGEVDNTVRIQVIDTGIGLHEEAVSRIFERFYRVDKARSRNTGGTGLGLAIVKHIVEVHNGNITVDSKLNQGTTFSVYLPIQPEESIDL